MAAGTAGKQQFIAPTSYSGMRLVWVAHPRFWQAARPANNNLFLYLLDFSFALCYTEQE